MPVCPTCGSDHQLGAKFCEVCGTKLSATCTSCGAPLGPAARFCRECGTPNAAYGGSPGRTSAQEGAVAPAWTPAAPVAERRLVTVLFTDLVGFTTLAEGRDPEETRDLLSRYFELAREIVTRYGGVVEKFIGDAVMAVWGAPVAQEDDAERAVRAALDLVAAVRGLSPGLQARAGVLTGEAAVTIGAVGQGMVAGDLVNTASRLQSAAAPGTVLVGEATQRAAAAIAFEPGGEQELKGKTLPVPAWRAVRVVAERGGRGRAEGLEAPFTGRDDELRLLKELFHATSRDGRARLVSVMGPAGIGKSRLAWEFVKYVDGLVENVWWHEGRSPAYGEGLSFWALGEMIRSRCQLAEGDDEATTRAKVAATVREHVPDDGERRWIEGALLTLLGVGEVTTGTAELFGAWRAFFERLSETGTVALVFEDFNNADTGTIDFVDHVLEWSRSRPLFVLTLSRPELLDRRPDWHAKRNFSSLTLEPLPEPAMRELLAGLVPGLPESAVRSIVARADGVPLYAVETVRMLLADGRLQVQDGRYVPVGDLADLAVPATLTALIASRLDGLDQAERVLIQDAAVLGQSFTAAGLAAVVGTSEAELEPSLRLLVRREILVVSVDPRSPERGQYAFTQGLIREVAYHTLARADRKRRHLAAARYFESLGSDELAGAIAGHYLAAHQNAAESPDASELAVKARDALVAAADRAASLGSYEQAAAFAEQALVVTLDEEARAALLERAGTCLARAALYERAGIRLREATEVQRARGDLRATARLIALLGRTLGAAHLPEEAIELLESAVVEFGDLAAEADGVELLVTLARVLMGAERYPGSLDAAEQAIIAAERLDRPDLVAQALIAKGGSLLSSGRAYEGVVVARGAIDLAEASGSTDDVLGARVTFVAGIGSMEPRMSMEMAQVGLGEARRIGDRSSAIRFIGNAADAARWTGDWDWAMAELDALLEGDLDVQDRSWMIDSAAVLRSFRGEDTSALVDEAESLYPEVGEFAPTLRADRESCRALAEGRLGDAREAAREYARMSPLGAPSALPVAARAGIWLRDPASAAEDLAALEALGVHGTFITMRRTAIAAGIAALEGRLDEARALYAEARRGMADRGIAVEVALVAIDMATTLGSADPDVQAFAAEARQVLARLGAVPFLARLDAALAGAVPAGERRDEPIRMA
jgi:class 3 adenylate cyclase/tetratricopeptide (TPR) repeat protein